MSKLDHIAADVIKGRTRFAPQWDKGADGKANQERLKREPATDFDPETGKETPNPNRVMRRRRQSWVDIYLKKEAITHRQGAAAEKLRAASEGLRDRDPLAAIGEVRTRSGAGDRAAARIDARRYYHELWALIPQASRPVIERVVLADEPIWSGCGKAARDRHMRRLQEGLDAIS